jgi:hypothetical protein
MTDPHVQPGRSARPRPTRRHLTLVGELLRRLPAPGAERAGSRADGAAG